ncbi:MAG: DUF2415 domain-containing protein, partial [Terriglobus roseus]|nr:DUF2415 domain-containing protein [Terriglobus roseus]
DASSSSHHDMFRAFQRPHIRIERLGTLIVNSVSIHRLPSADPDVDDEVVAVLTNNDRYVRIYSLTQEAQIMEDSFPFHINHATLSPDGKMLVVVGDKEFAYFYERVDDLVSVSPKRSSLGRRYAQYKWHLLSHYELHRPPRASSSAYFTTAWSSTGTLCAMASQEGFITVIDVRAIARGNMDAPVIVAIVPSSNPSTIGDHPPRRGHYGGPGAVRTMCFAPEPWDLLIWSEQTGRICVGDLRNGLLTRQVVDLDPKAEGVTKISLHDGPDALELSSLLDLQADSDRWRRASAPFGSTRSSSGRASTDHRFTSQSVEASLENHTLPTHTQSLDWNPSRTGLSDEEQLVLDGLRTSRSREDSIRREITQSANHDPESSPLARTATQSAPRSEVFLQRNLDIDRLSSVYDLMSTRLPRAVARRIPDPSDPARSSDPWRTVEAAIERFAEPNGGPMVGAGLREQRNRDHQRAELLERQNAVRRLRPRDPAGSTDAAPTSSTSISATTGTVNPAALSIASERSARNEFESLRAVEGMLA